MRSFAWHMSVSQGISEYSAFSEGYASRFFSLNSSFFSSYKSVRSKMAVEDGMTGNIVEGSRHPEPEIIPPTLRQVSRVYGAAWKPRALT